MIDLSDLVVTVEQGKELTRLCGDTMPMSRYIWTKWKESDWTILTREQAVGLRLLEGFVFYPAPTAEELGHWFGYAFNPDCPEGPHYPLHLYPQANWEYSDKATYLGAYRAGSLAVEGQGKTLAQALGAAVIEGLKQGWLKPPESRKAGE